MSNEAQPRLLIFDPSHTRYLNQDLRTRAILKCFFFVKQFTDEIQNPEPV